MNLFTVYCSDGRYDENYFVKCKDAKTARRLVRAASDYRVVAVEQLESNDELFRGRFGIKPSKHKANKPYCYDSGT